jgi:hypothetical protein
MGKFKAGDLVSAGSAYEKYRVVAVDDDFLWLKGTNCATRLTRQDNLCTLYVPPPEVGRRYKKSGDLAIGELVAVKDKWAVMYRDVDTWIWPLADLIPAEAP